MAVLTNEDYKKIALWLEANAMKDTSFESTGVVDNPKDIIAIVRYVNGIPINYKININDLLNSGISQAIIDQITVAQLQVNESLKIKASQLLLDNDTSLQTIFNSIEEDINGIHIEKLPVSSSQTTVRESYGLIDNYGRLMGTPINIYKDSALRQVYLGTIEDTCDPTTGTPTKKPVTSENGALCFIYYLSNGQYTLVSIPTSSFFSEASYDSTKGLGVTAGKQVYIKLSNDSETSQYLTFNPDTGAVQLKNLKLNEKVDIVTTFKVTAPSYDATMPNAYKEVVEFENNAFITLNVVQKAMGNGHSNILWFNNGTQPYFLSLLDTGIVLAKKANNKYSLYIPATSRYSPSVSYEFQLLQCTGNINNLTFKNGDVSTLTNVKKPFIIKYTEPFNETNAGTFNITNGNASLYLINYNDFIGKVTDNTTKANITVHNEELNRIYRFTFDKDLESVTLKQYNGIELCTIENVIAGDIYTLTSISNEENGWLVSNKKAEIYSSDKSVSIEYINGSWDLKVPVSEQITRNKETKIFTGLNDNTFKGTLYTAINKNGYNILGNPVLSSRYSEGTLTPDVSWESFIKAYDFGSGVNMHYYTLDGRFTEFIARFYSMYGKVESLDVQAWGNNDTNITLLLKNKGLIFTTDANIVLPTGGNLQNGYSCWIIGKKALIINGMDIASRTAVYCLYDKGEWFLSYTANAISSKDCDDAARYILGGDWRIPTSMEWLELFNNTALTWVTEGTRRGVRCTATNGNSIFIPAVGGMSPTITGVNSLGEYLISNTMYGSDDFSQGIFYFRYVSGTIYKQFNYYPRYYGFAIRAVSKNNGVDLGLSIKWASSNLGSSIDNASYNSYYAWGEVVSKMTYSKSNYRFYDGVTETPTKYNSTDNLKVLQLGQSCYADTTIYNDINTNLNADNVQTAIEKLATTKLTKWAGTKDEYDALGDINDDTLYCIIDEE